MNDDNQYLTREWQDYVFSMDELLNQDEQDIASYWYTMKASYNLNQLDMLNLDAELDSHLEPSKTDLPMRGQVIKREGNVIWLWFA